MDTIDPSSYQKVINSFKPTSFTEVLLFGVSLISVYLIGVLLFYNSVQMSVKKTSRCYRDKQAVTSSGTFTATATNQRNEPLYTVGYNMASKSFSVDCACPAGSVANTYPNIDIYNISTQQANRIDNKMCSCDKQYYAPAYDSIYYTGYPGVTRFMNSAAQISDSSQVTSKADTSFFTDALYGPAS
jgi:hypothetical protein